MTDATNRDLAEVAAESTALRQVIELVGWVGQGRRLTQTGAITLADARTLVDLLHTGDVIDRVIGDRVFRTKSSTELLALNLIVEWAKAARLVRVVKGRLMPVRKAAALVDRPAELWTALFTTFGKLGPAFLPTGWGQSLLRAEFGAGSAAILSALHLADGPIDLEKLRALAWDTVSSFYTFPGATEQQLHTARRMNGRDVGRALAALALLGAVTLTDETAELTPLGRDGTRRARGEPAPGEPVHRITVTLCEVDAPRVWRRLLVPAATPLDRLHHVIQAAMGWQDSHLHSFSDGRRYYGQPDPELGFVDERSVRLSDLGAGRIGYTYDFGDSWEHEIVVEAVVEAEAGGHYPRCLDGEGACPPEDCGGSPGYQRLREVLADPDDVEHEEMLSWLGLDRAAEFDPAAFDVEQADQRLQSLGARR